MARTIIIMAGGTGGHIFPGLAVAAFLRDQGWRVIWLGTQQGMETTMVPQYGFPLETIRFSAARGQKAFDYVLLPWRLQRACWQSLRILRRLRPDVVLGLGGYPALPGGMMATLLGIPLIIHEQNTVAGLTNKVLAKIADRILLAFPGALSGHKKNLRVTGNPIRAEIARLLPPEHRYRQRSGKLKLLIVGGSLGAQKLNTVIPQALAMMDDARRPLIVHQAGKAHLADLEKTYAEVGVTAQLVAFIENIAAQYADSDLVICRAGALTVSELAAAGVASILVPYPYAVDDHQTSNAHFLSDAAAAVLWPQSELTPSSLAEWLHKCSRESLQIMAVKARQLALPDATALVADACREMLEPAR
ncbi:MAG: undecaprenyldiphospho-muramoylpentapeptide beta-N-acetylglucosaminyltransferase [Nitrosomonas sp.]|nr:undecaprenyldiphospho-muramoylpentapeptide beta-N-acetylglucosaminyltransferase [Nitrosomonas sp.]